MVTIAVRVVRKAINRRRDGGCLAPEMVVQGKVKTILIEIGLNNTRPQYIFMNILVHVQGQGFHEIPRVIPPVIRLQHGTGYRCIDL